MPKPRVLILRAPGTNCDAETAHAFELAGGRTERLHVNQILQAPKQLGTFQILCIPGGFSYGDDISAGRILGNQIQHHLAETLSEFRDQGKLVLGICNGFQVLLKTNLLVPSDAQGSTATLTINDRGKFESRWVRLAVEASKCVFLQGLTGMELPVAHGEGKFVTRDLAVFDRLRDAGSLALRYTAERGGAVRIGSESTVSYPANPNGAMGDIAGVCDYTGRVFGLMPHPERFVDWTQHPQWTREVARSGGIGLRVFQNAVQYFS